MAGIRLQLSSIARTWRRHESLVWAVILVAIVAYRWPLLKGYYYKRAGAPAPKTSIAWRGDFGAALAEAKASGRPVLVDFSADWCPPCQAMKHDVWPDPEVERAVSAGFVPVLLDVDHDGGISDRYKVDSIPTVMILGADGQVVRQAGYLPRSGLLRFLGGR